MPNIPSTPVRFAASTPSILYQLAYMQQEGFVSGFELQGIGHDVVDILKRRSLAEDDPQAQAALFEDLAGRIRNKDNSPWLKLVAYKIIEEETHPERREVARQLLSMPLEETRGFLNRWRQLAATTRTAASSGLPVLLHQARSNSEIQKADKPAVPRKTFTLPVPRALQLAVGAARQGQHHLANFLINSERELSLHVMDQIAGITQSLGHLRTEPLGRGEKREILSTIRGALFGDDRVGKRRPQQVLLHTDWRENGLANLLSDAFIEEQDDQVKADIFHRFLDDISNQVRLPARKVPTKGQVRQARTDTDLKGFWGELLDVFDSLFGTTEPYVPLIPFRPDISQHLVQAAQAQHQKVQHALRQPRYLSNEDHHASFTLMHGAQHYFAWQHPTEQFGRLLEIYRFLRDHTQSEEERRMFVVGVDSCYLSSCNPLQKAALTRKGFIDEIAGDPNPRIAKIGKHYQDTEQWPSPQIGILALPAPSKTGIEIL